METTKKILRKANVNNNICVACGACTKVCPKDAISVWNGCFAKVNHSLCIGCGKCAKICPASCITIGKGEENHEE